MSDDESSAATSSSKEEQATVGRPAKKPRTDADDPKNSFPAATPLELAPVHPSSFSKASSSSFSSSCPPVIVLLDQASLETVKNRRGAYELLNCDDHRDLCRKKLKKDPNDFRPDICHQELLALLDSPLNKAGLLQVYIRTTQKVLIQVHPSIRIPRTYKRFAGLMVQLLHKMKIKAGKESTTLLKVIKNPFSQHLPAGTRCFGFSCQGTLHSPVALAKAFLPPLPPSKRRQSSPSPTCLIVGAMSTGHVSLNDHPYIEQMLSISEYPLSGASALSRIMTGIEHQWGIV